jgi:hypothetical protein
MQVAFDIAPGFTAHVMGNWSAGFRARRLVVGLSAVFIPALVAIALGVWQILIVGLFCVALMVLRSRTRQQAALAALDDDDIPRITVSLQSDHVTIQSGEHSWARRHASLLRRVTETPEAIILAFANSMTSGIPLSALDSPREWKDALDSLSRLGERDREAHLRVDPPGTSRASVSLPPETTGVAFSSKLVLLIICLGGFYFCPPLKEILQLGAGVLGYLSGVLFLMAILSEIAFPAISAPCEVILTDEGIYLHSGAQDAFCGWQACIDAADDHDGIHLVGEWGAPFISISGEFLTPEFADFARQRIIETHGSLPSHDHEEHDHDHHDDCDHDHD